MSIATDGERILAVYAVVNPDKLEAERAVTRAVRPHVFAVETEETTNESTNRRHEIS